VGKPEIPAPVPPPVTEYVILVIAVLMQRACRLVPTPDVKVITAFGFTISVLLDDVVPHDPPTVVSVKVAVPLYPGGGVHVAVKVDGLGLKDPPAVVDHIPPVAEPPTLPPSEADVLPWHIALNADPAFAVGNGVTVTVVVSGMDVPHPVAVTLIVAMPVKPGAHVTVPVVPVPDIVLPVPVTPQL
jgi:hypothetical protein